MEKTVPVGRFAPNALGLFELHGNADEWVADLWNDSYIGAPTDGSAWMTSDCGHAVLRGGSYGSNGWYVRSAMRFFRGQNSAGDFYGFRVARSFAL